MQYVSSLCLASFAQCYVHYIHPHCLCRCSVLILIAVYVFHIQYNPIHVHSTVDRMTSQTCFSLWEITLTYLLALVFNPGFSIFILSVLCFFSILLNIFLVFRDCSFAVYMYGSMQEAVASHMQTSLWSAGLGSCLQVVFSTPAM